MHRHPDVHEHDVGSRGDAPRRLPSAPSSALPTTSMSGWASSSAPKPWRTSDWSSTTSTVIMSGSLLVARQHGGDLEAAVGGWIRRCTLPPTTAARSAIPVRPWPGAVGPARSLPPARRLDRFGRRTVRHDHPQERGLVGQDDRRPPRPGRAGPRSRATPARSGRRRARPHLAALAVSPLVRRLTGRPALVAPSTSAARSASTGCGAYAGVSSALRSTPSRPRISSSASRGGRADRGQLGPHRLAHVRDAVRRGLGRNDDQRHAVRDDVVEVAGDPRPLLEHGAPGLLDLAELLLTLELAPDLRPPVDQHATGREQQDADRPTDLGVDGGHRADHQRAERGDRDGHDQPGGDRDGDDREDQDEAERHQPGPWVTVRDRDHRAHEPCRSRSKQPRRPTAARRAARSAQRRRGRGGSRTRADGRVGSRR